MALMESGGHAHRQPEQRQPSGCRYVLIGLLAAFFAALIFVLGLVTGGGSVIYDRIAAALGMPLAATPQTTIISRDAVLERVRQVSRLETTIFTLERVIEAKQSDQFWPDWLRGERLLLIANGTVIAGVDLGQLKPEAVTVSPDGSAVTIDLPPVQIFNINSILDNSKTRVYDRQTGIFAAPDQNLETQARQAAEGEILKAACHTGIMQRATDDAQHALAQLMELYDFKVTVRAAPVPACPMAATED
jgi:hypothetical protein